VEGIIVQKSSINYLLSSETIPDVVSIS